MFCPWVDQDQSHLQLETDYGERDHVLGKSEGHQSAVL